MEMRSSLLVFESEQNRETGRLDVLVISGSDYNPLDK